MVRETGNRLLALGLFGALGFLGGCATPNSEGPTSRSRVFEVEGHRGTRSARPENTLSAFRYALDAGVDTLEMDLHVTRDGVLVITHDPAIDPDRCVDRAGKRPVPGILIRRLSLRQVQSYACGRTAKERIPTFEELLAWLAHDPNPRAQTVFLNVETKSDPAHPEFSPPPKEFASRIIAMTKKYGVFDRLILQSFDDRTLKAAREIDPKTVLSVLIAERPRSTLAEVATDLHAQIVSPNYVWLSGVDVESLHVLGIRVVPWTVDSERDWRRLAAMGVDGIITDDPRGLLEFRRKYFAP